MSSFTCSKSPFLIAHIILSSACAIFTVVAVHWNCISCVVVLDLRECKLHFVWWWVRWNVVFHSPSRLNLHYRLLELPFELINHSSYIFGSWRWCIAASTVTGILNCSVGCSFIGFLERSNYEPLLFPTKQTLTYTFYRRIVFAMLHRIAMMMRFFFCCWYLLYSFGEQSTIQSKRLINDVVFEIQYDY